MIGKLRGRVDSVLDDYLILDVGGVGYLVFASSRTLSQVEGLSGEVALVIETHVREDHIHLYGFLSEAERTCFRLLTAVQGVGSKHGLAILSALSPEEVTNAIAAQDTTSFTRAHGVGKKLAERITNELRTKIATMPTTQVATIAKGAATSAPSSSSPSLQQDAVSALVHLGYPRLDAFQAVAHALQEDKEAGLDAIIKRSLQELAA